VNECEHEGSVSEASYTDSGTFLNWAKGCFTPLALGNDYSVAELTAFRKVIGGANVVALTEAVHGGAEPLELRNNLFRYLVEEEGFTAIAIESGTVEGRLVHDYVRGAEGDLAQVLSHGISWTFDQLPQNRALLRWMREYNLNPRNRRKINFYGFDVPGSPGNPDVKFGLSVALVEIARYLESVDPARGASLRARLEPHLRYIRFSFRPALGMEGYEQLSAAERDAVTACIADLITLLEQREAQYIEGSSESDYAWGYQAARGAQQVDSWLRQIPIGWRPSSGPLDFPSEDTAFYAAAADVRDRAQANNLDWILRREGPDAKVLIFGSRFHLSNAPVKTSWSMLPERRQTPAGTYLRSWLGSKLVTIGNLVRHGEFYSAGATHRLDPAAAVSLDGIVGELGRSSFLLDLRSAPPDISAWLKREHCLGPPNGLLEVSAGTAFDALFYVDRVTPADA